jgi:acetyl esterase/lipase
MRCALGTLTLVNAVLAAPKSLRPDADPQSLDPPHMDAHLATNLYSEATMTESMKIWPDGGAPPGEVRANCHYDHGNCDATLDAYLVDDPPAGGAPAVILFPAGGFFTLVPPSPEHIRHMNNVGVSVLVLRYRVPAPTDMSIVSEATGVNADEKWTALLDARQGMHVAHRNAHRWHLDPKRIGVLGFSAGGALAAALMNEREDIDRRRYRPAFVAMISPGGYNSTSCSQDEPLLFLEGLYSPPPAPPSSPPSSSTQKTGLHRHEPRIGQACSMLSPNDKLLLQVRDNWPPTFLVHAKDDPTTDYHGSNVLHDALMRNAKTYKDRQKHERHIFETGGHMMNPSYQKCHCNVWNDAFVAFLQKTGVLCELDPPSTPPAPPPSLPPPESDD